MSIDGYVYPSGLPDTSQLDRMIADNVRDDLKKYQNGTPPVVISIYGAAHYNKPNDLNEKLPGVSVAIQKGPGEMRGEYLGGSSADDVPEYAYYIDSKRLVKIDNDAARAEFMGLSSQEFTTYVKHGLPKLGRMEAKEAQAPATGFSPTPVVQSSANTVAVQH
jgi:hypothetical protein